MKDIEIYTDGACSGNPGAGGWACILKYEKNIKELHGGAPQTTNNRMELMGVIMGLAAVTERCNITVTTDSKYVCDSVNKGWAKSWQTKNWKKSDGKYAQNVELWEILLSLLNKHNVTFVWVKGHAGHPENERCDNLAVQEREKWS